jgi:hypothetical protein
MLKIDSKLKDAGQLDGRIKLSQMLAEWVKFETVFSPIYEQIKRRFKQALAQTDARAAAGRQSDGAGIDQVPPHAFCFGLGLDTTRQNTDLPGDPNE